MNLGHVSRALAIAEGLRARGHVVAFAGGARAADVLGARGETVIDVPIVQQVVVGGRIRRAASVGRNLRTLLGRRAIIAALVPRVEAFAPDLVVSDYERFSADAADQIGVPVVSLDHQHVVTELVLDVPARYRIEALLTAAVIRRAAAQRPVHRIITSFFRAPLRDPARATVVGPILRDDIVRARPERGAHVLVYANQGDGRALFRTLAAVDARFLVYGGELDVPVADHGHVRVRRFSRAGFVEDLATARAVVCTAGNGLMSEALFLGKPVLALPLGGTFEQTCNALALERAGLGEAVYRRPLRPADLDGFLGRAVRYAARLPLRSFGNVEALERLEWVLGARASVGLGAAA